MTTNGRPGVFINEQLSPLSTGTPGIPGEAMPAFAGVFPSGPTGPQLITSWSSFLKTYGGFAVAPGNLLPFAVNQFFANGGSSCFVLRVPNSDASPSSLILEDVNTPDPDNILTVTALSPGTWGEGIYVEAVSAGQSGRFNLNVYLGATTPAALVETYQDVTMNPADTRNVVSAVSTLSNYISVAATFPNGTYISGLNDLALVAPTPLTGGTNGTVAPVLGTVVPAQLGTLPNQILNLNLPGVTDYTTLSTLINWAQRLGNVMLVIDGPVPEPGETPATVTAEYVNLVDGSSALPISTYAVVYAPWVVVSDPSSSISGALTTVPPGGLALGQWQITDIQHGPQKTPAGIGNVLQAVGLEVQFTAAELDTLNDAQVNAIQLRPGIGYCLFGGRTLHPGYPDRYISTRRSLMLLEHDLQSISQFALFETNDGALWAQLTSIFGNYLTQQFQAGLLVGDSVSDAFAVTCDDTTNPPAAAQAGIVSADIGVAVGSPAEWINITISQIQSTGTSTASSATS